MRTTAILGPMDDDRERHINIHFSPDIMAGVYSNFANVSHSEYEFTVTSRASTTRSTTTRSPALSSRASISRPASCAS